MRTPIRIACGASLLLALFACDKGGEGSDPGGSKAESAPKGDADDGDAVANGDDGTKPGEKAKPGEDGKQGEGSKADKGEKKAELAKNSFQVPTKEEVAKAKADHKSHLDAGRKAVKAKDYKKGITELKQAKDLAPMNGKVLGELGWAYFLDAQYDKAQTELVLALQHADNDKTRGAVLYNLGRVEEERGNEAIAADHYRASLDRRPNDTVQSRLDGLGVSEDSQHAQCTFAKEAGSTPYDLCGRYLSEYEDADEVDPPECGFDATKPRDLPEDYAVAAGEEIEMHETVFMLEGDGYKATVFSVVDYGLSSESFVLAVVVGDSWYTASLTEVYHPGVGYADESVDSVELSAEELTGGGKKELLVRWHVSGHDMDPGIEWMDDYRHENLAVVSLDSGAPAWMATVRTQAESASGEMDPDEWGAMVKPDEYKAGATESFADGSITVTKEGSDAPKSSPTGTFKLGAYPVLCPSEQDYFGL